MLLLREEVGRKCTLPSNENKYVLSFKVVNFKPLRRIMLGSHFSPAATRGTTDSLPN